MSNIKVNVNSQNLTSIRVGQQNATKVVSSVGGLQGIQGLQGRQGLQGIAGQFAGQGAQGPLGGLGDQGTQGLQGLQGNIGYQGTQGLQGTQGRQGLQGNIGIQGFVGQPGGNAGRIFYFNRTDLSDIPGFYRATETPSPHDLSSTVVGLSTTDDIVIDQFVTDLNSPGVSDLPVGDAEITLHVQLSEGSAAVTLNVFLCESDGSGIFPISSSTSDIFTNTTIQQLNWSYVRTIPYSLGVTRRLIYNFHVNKITGSDSATLTAYYEDNLASHIKSTISAGAVGPQGIQGTQGTQGLQGNRGQQGAQGLLGRQGIQGISGEFAGQGLQGSQGIQGTQGPQGTQGVQSSQGTQGVQATQGTQGTQGLQGVQGNNNGGVTVVNDVSTNALRFIAFENITSGVSTNVGVSSTKLTFNPSTGNLGIGTTNPTQILDVAGRLVIGSSGLDHALYIRRVTDNTVGVTFGYPLTNSNTELSLRHNAGTGNFTIHLNGTGGEQGNGFNEKFRFTSAAQLGIGRSNPSAELDVFGGANFTNRVLIGSATSTGTASQTLQVTGGAYVSGNLGIGTTNPTSKLHVVGNTLITGITTVGLGTTSTPPSNSQMSFELTTDTNLRIKVKGTDGVLRSGNITLS